MIKKNKSHYNSPFAITALIKKKKKNTITCYDLYLEIRTYIMANKEY